MHFFSLSALPPNNIKKIMIEKSIFLMELIQECFSLFSEGKLLFFPSHLDSVHHAVRALDG